MMKQSSGYDKHIGYNCNIINKKNKFKLELAFLNLYINLFILMRRDFFMVLDDFEDEDLAVKGENISFKFGSKKAKNNFLIILENMVEKQDRVNDEGYKCGNCAVYPCFRIPSFDIDLFRGYSP